VQQKLAVLSPGCLLLAIQDHPPLNNTCVHSWEIGLVVKIKKKKKKTPTQSAVHFNASRCKSNQSLNKVHKNSEKLWYSHGLTNDEYYVTT
jgi:hypothetical protein